MNRRVTSARALALPLLIALAFATPADASIRYYAFKEMVTNFPAIAVVRIDRIVEISVPPTPRADERPRKSWSTKKPAIGLPVRVAVATVLKPLKGLQVGQQIAIFLQHGITNGARGTENETALLYLQAPPSREGGTSLFLTIDFPRYHEAVKQQLPGLPVFRVPFLGQGFVSAYIQDGKEYVMDAIGTGLDYHEGPEFGWAPGTIPAPNAIVAPQPTAERPARYKYYYVPVTDIEVKVNRILASNPTHPK